MDGVSALVKVIQVKGERMGRGGEGRVRRHLEFVEPEAWLPVLPRKI